MYMYSYILHFLCSSSLRNRAGFILQKGVFFSIHVRFLELLIVKTSASTNQIVIHLAVWRRSREITYTLEVVFHLILAPNGL